jgi:hypothetical protein
MKQKLKKLKQVFGVTLAVILLLGCQNDFDDNIIKESKQIRFEKVSLNDLMPATNNELFASVDKLEKKIKNTHAKTVYNSTYNFSYDDENGIFIGEGTYSSYTFPIKREGGDGKVENIVFSKKQDGTYETLLFKYDLQEEELNFLSKEEFLEADVIVTDLNTGSITAKCQATVTLCNNDGSGGIGALHVAETGCCRANNQSHLTTYTYEVSCGTGSGTGGTGSSIGGSLGTGGNTGGTGTTGSSNGNTGSSGSTGGVGSSGGNYNAVITVPVANLNTPCVALKKMSDALPNKEALNNLKTKTNLPSENGFAFKKDASTPSGFSNPVPIQTSTSNPGQLNMKFYLGGSYIGVAHTHPDPAGGVYFPMFSPEDIRTLKDLSIQHNNNGQPKDYSDYVVTLTVPTGTFAIKIKNKTDFYNFMNLNYSNFKNKLELKYQESQTTASMDVFKTDILDLLKHYNAGIGLFEANANNTAWSEVVIDDNSASPTFNSPILKPCI